ncbi:hypothetical protein ACKKBG_A01560 [Auxenochlorella protothecoides x Auxenochlorella symbiontica]
MSDPYALNDDGTAKDPAAFRAALKADPAKLEAIEKEPEVAEVVLGNDDHAFQELIKSVFHTEKKRQERLNRTMAERTIDAQRASATVPRDTVQLYAQLRESGLQYGPAFRLLRNVHVPDIAA